MKTVTQEEIFEDAVLLGPIFEEKLLDIFPRKYKKYDWFSGGNGDEDHFGTFPEVLYLRGGWRILQLLDFYSVEEAKSFLREIIDYDSGKAKTTQNVLRVFGLRGKETLVVEKRGNDERLKTQIMKMLIAFKEKEGFFFPNLILGQLSTSIFFYSRKEGRFKRIRHYDEEL